MIVAVAINSLSTGFFESGGSTHGPPTSSAGGIVGSQDLSPEAGGRVTSEVSLGRRTLEIKKREKVFGLIVFGSQTNNRRNNSKIGVWGRTFGSYLS